MVRTSILSLFLVACGGTGASDSGVGPTAPACEGYPEGAIEPMALNEVLTPYSWPDARNLLDGTQGDLDLALAPCASDPDIDWSPFDVLLFVSIPAW